MCRGKAEVWDEPEESRCREAAVLAEDDRGCSAERDVDSGILPAAPREGKPVLLVATQTESRPSGTEQAACSGQSSQFRPRMPAGLELVLQDGRRLRISQGVQEETLRAVLAAMESGSK
jgi:hypothetical protein